MNIILVIGRDIISSQRTYIVQTVPILNENRVHEWRDFFMSEKIKTILALLIIIILLPIVLTFFLQSGKIELPNFMDRLIKVPQEKETEEEATEVLTGILAGQISTDFDPEVLKAQAVLVRTGYERDKAAGKETAYSLSLNEMEQMWGSEKLKSNYERCRRAVVQTKGEVLTYQDQYILPCYTRVSAGRTREADSLGGEETPYLKSVLCDSDILSEDYLAVLFYSFDEFRKKMGLSEEVTEEEVEKIQVKTDTAGYVSQVKVGEFVISGDEMRERFELNSPCFFIRRVDDQMRIVTKGLGHGYGMSQYAANIMASSEKNYKEILSFFFPGTVLTKIIE